MNDVVDRLRESERTLQRMAAVREGEAAARLRGKAEGLRLAMGYLHEAEGGGNVTLAPSPPWHNAAPGISQMRTLVAEKGPVAVHELDQLRATIRGVLDEVEVSLHDEHAVYFGLVWTGLVTEIARYGYANARIDGDTYQAIGEIVATIGAALLDYVPKDIGHG